MDESYHISFEAQSNPGTAMIKFFRHIRQRLLSKNQLSKYLLYAIGEIILVVIGILIALQINNWNESNKLKNEEILYVKRLQIDLKKDTIYYNKSIKRAHLLIDRNYSFLKKIYEEQHTIAEGLDLMNTPLWDSDYLTIEDNTYRELVSSGKLNIISNSTLKVNIVDFYRLVESNKTYIKEFNEYSRMLMGNHVSTYPGTIKQTRSPQELATIINDRMFRLEDFQFLNNPSSSQFQSLEDIIMVYIDKHKEFIKLYNEQKTRAEDILYLMEQEVTKTTN